MQIAPLDTEELVGWLTRVSQTIDRSLRGPARAATTAELRRGLDGTNAGLAVLTQLALLDDCLRVAHLALEADGVIEADELARVADLVGVAAAKFFAVLPEYESFGDGASAPGDVERFVRVHRADRGPFGFAHPEHWRGLRLARAVEQHAHNAMPLREHERMLARVMDEVFGGRSTEIERAARRRLRELFEPALPAGVDPRAVAFCRGDGPEVFSGVAHGSQFFLRDPFDVEAIHAEARAVLHAQVERATMPAQHATGHGRTLLVLGDSGAGKTHLLRALRTQVHAQRMGYVGYMQMTTEVGDYARYALRSMIDSLERPYDAPGLSESALMYLSDGVAEGRAEIPRGDLEQIRAADLAPDELERVLGRCVDRIVRSDGLHDLESDLLQALLLLQRRDPAIQRRVVRFLRCEPLSNYDRQLLGGLAPRDQPEDALRTIRQLALIMHELHFAALVLVVDQIEEAIPDGQTVTRIQQAFDSLRAISDAVPSAVVVIACLSDVYDAIRGKLVRSLVDRLEHDPAPVRLRSQRTAEEVEQMLAARLEYLYTVLDAPWREDDPLFPFTAAQVQAVSQLRARDCLAQFRDYHAACITAHAIIAAPDGEPQEPEQTLTGLPVFVVDDEPIAEPSFEGAWREAVQNAATLPEEDDAIMMAIEEGVGAAAYELGLELAVRRTNAYLTLEGAALSRRVVRLCNGRLQGGQLGRQLDALRETMKQGTTSLALRSSDWKLQARSSTALRVGSYKEAGGRTATLEEHELREIVGVRALIAANPHGLAAWRKRDRPHARLSVIREILDLDRAPITAPAPVTSRIPVVPPVAVAPPVWPVAPELPMVAPPPGPRADHVAGPPAFDPQAVRLGVQTTLRAPPVSLALDDIKRHVAFLGSSGSGKTTIALSVVEQLLERGISVLLVDRKGDLARYASDAWWAEPTQLGAARKADLRKRVIVNLFTPGNPQGRPLRLPLIPSMRDASSTDKEQLASFAAAGLAAMMGLGRGLTATHKESVLKCAIEVLADQPEITLDDIHATISRPDPQLLVAVDALQRHFASLSECVQSLRIQRGALLSGTGEQLDVEALLPPPSERPQLSIISTAAFTDVAVLQFWVSRLLVDLGRLARKRPSPTLQSAAFFDEADVYIPATSNPATKLPMFDLLRRARSGGLGIMLATQNPGDFDYKARDNIGTWLVGKVAQARAIEKMRNLLANYPNVGPRLASQSAGQFFVLSEGPPHEIRADRALMTTTQLSDEEVLELARGNARRTHDPGAASLRASR